MAVDGFDDDQVATAGGLQRGDHVAHLCAIQTADVDQRPVGQRAHHIGDADVVMLDAQIKRAQRDALAGQVVGGDDPLNRPAAHAHLANKAHPHAGPDQHLKHLVGLVLRRHHHHRAVAQVGQQRQCRVVLAGRGPVGREADAFDQRARKGQGSITAQDELPEDRSHQLGMTNRERRLHIRPGWALASTGIRGPADGFMQPHPRW